VRVPFKRLTDGLQLVGSGERGIVRPPFPSLLSTPRIVRVGSQVGTSYRAARSTGRLLRDSIEHERPNSSGYEPDSVGWIGLRV
jgi:hypothetical protein